MTGLHLSAEKLALRPDRLTSYEEKQLFDSAETFPLYVKLQTERAAKMLAAESECDAPELFHAILLKDLEAHARRISAQSYMRSSLKGYVAGRTLSSRKSKFVIGKIVDQIRPKKGHFFDLGCGFGFSMIHAINAGFEKASGIEVDPAHTDIADPIFRKNELPIEYRKGDFLSEFYNGTCFDLVFCQDVLEHISSIEDCLDKTSALLKEDGTAVFRVASGRCVGVVSSESHYRIPLLSLFDREGSDICFKFGLTKRREDFVVERWPTIEDFSSFSDRSEFDVFFSYENFEVPGAHFAYDSALWRRKLEIVDRLIYEDEKYAALAERSVVKDWRERVDAALSAWDAGNPPSDYDVADLFPAYWNVAISRTRPAGDWRDVREIIRSR